METFCVAKIANTFCFLIWHLVSDFSVRLVNGNKTVPKGKTRGCHDANRHGAAPPELDMDTRETKLLFQNACRRTSSFYPVEGISLEGFDQF